MAYGKDPADRVPAPDKLKGRMPADDGDEMPGETEGDEDKAEAVSKMQDFLDVLGIKGVDAEAACDALDLYNDAANRRK